MPSAAVVAFARVLHDQLPVRLFDQRYFVRELGLGEVVRLEVGRERGAIGLEGRRLLGEADEDRAFDGLDVDRLERNAAGIELLVHATRIEQLSGEVVRPLVIGTGEAQALSALGIADLETAVPAGVEEGANHASTVAHNDDRCAADGEREILAGARDLAFRACENPLLVEDQLEVELVEGGVAVEALREREELLAG